jgi:predicted acyl esterase
MVQVQSTWFPLADINPQRFEDINRAKAGDFQKAVERIYHNAEMPSQVKIGVLPVPRAPQP